jgi:two-component system sensor histidine kinase UhpB
VKARSLLSQVLAVNLLLVASTVLVATVVVHNRASGVREAFILGAALVATLLGNWLLLSRRFHPLDELISTMERMDLSQPARLPDGRGLESAEVTRLKGAFRRMISRLEAERRHAGRVAIQAQERERRRIAQDLHDEVNQALTAVSLRLQATIAHASPELQPELIETKRLAGQAMEELLALARQLRPAVLDDHGLVAALDSQVSLFAEQSGISARFTMSGEPVRMTPEQQLVIYRVTQESLSNIAQHADARRVTVELSSVGAAMLAVTDDGAGFAAPRDGGLGLSGMRERALLIGGRLSVFSAPGRGTRVELVLT